MSVGKSVAVFIVLLIIAAPAHADPIVLAQANLTCTPTGLGSLPPCYDVPGVAPGPVAAMFDLGGSIFTISIGSTTFTVPNPTITFGGDTVTGIRFSIWGEIPGMNARMQAWFASSDLALFGCALPPCAVTLPPASFADYPLSAWGSAFLYIRADSNGIQTLPRSETPVIAATAPYMDASITSLSTIPEPSTWLLLGTGLLGLIAIRKKSTVTDSPVSVPLLPDRPSRLARRVS